MTVADPKHVFSNEPSARRGAGQRGLGDVLGGEGRRKVDADIADLIIMSSLDDKAPAEMAGSGALLDTLVAAHLEGAGVLETEMPAAVEGAGPSNDGHMELLQREIELLLRGEAPAEAAVEMPQAEAEGAVEDLTGVAGVTQGEMDALLPPVAEVAEVADVADVAETVADVGEGEAGLTEAEGVLAEELAQLMADSQVKVDATGGEGSAGVEAEHSVAEESGAVQVEGGVIGDIEAAGDGEFEAPPVVVELPEEAEVEVAGPGVLGRVRGLVGNVALLLAQVFDMPFGWIGVAEKNILGVVAFMLLVSGVVLYVMAWVYR